jgi:4,5-DOPA dioxygenase extradiol
MLGEKLQLLRDQGVLIVGSGNIVHNLRQIIWNENTRPYDWAEEFDLWAKQKLKERDFHTLGACSKEDELSFVYEGIQNGSISMRAVAFGLSDR